MKDKNFLVGVIIAIVLVSLYKCTSSTKPKQNQTEEGTLTLLDLNYISTTPSKATPGISFSVYKQIADGQFEEKQVKLENYKGKPVILHFWATWCGPCMMELPKYDAFANNPDIHNIAILSENQPPQTIAMLYKKRSIANLAITIDAKMMLAQVMGVRGLPTTIFIDKEGNEIGRVVGMVEWDNKRAVNLLLTQLR